MPNETATPATTNGCPPPLITIVIPFYNEEACVDQVCEELLQVMREEANQVPAWEAVLVDDGSGDRTGRLIDDWARRPPFRAVHIHPNSGQSAALAAGFQAARGIYIATMDGDGQNDPRDLPSLLVELQRREIDMLCGIRQRRADGFVRKASSRVANRVRRAVLHDGITDVGCSMRVFRRECLSRVPFFRNAHRFFPALVMAAGGRVAETPVRHRPRHMGASKYGGGINSRLWVGLADLAGVAWLTRRALRYQLATPGERRTMDTPPSGAAKRHSDGWGKDLLKIVTISCFFVGMAVLLRNGALSDPFLRRPLLQEILSTGDTPGQVCRHAFLFVGTFSLLIGVGLPRLWVSAIAGAAFGAREGTLLALAASVIGAAIVYHIGRTLLADLLKRRFARHLAVWQTRFQQNAFWWVLYMRLFPLSNATLAGLVCGACRLPVKPYLAGSLLGFIPLTVVFAVFGNGGAKGNFYQIALGTLLLLLAVGGRKLLAAAFRPPQPLAPGNIQN